MPCNTRRPGPMATLSFAVSGQILNPGFMLGAGTNGGGLTGVWAEENSRDSIFAALQRRETFATSGTRPVVRMFGGFTLPADMCRKGNFAQKGYDNGVPMGGSLSGPTVKAPSFAVAATMDPGWTGRPGTKLQRAQIIQGWVDGAGQTHEQVYDIAGDPNGNASVDLYSWRRRRGRSLPGQIQERGEADARRSGVLEQRDDRDREQHELHARQPDEQARVGHGQRRGWGSLERAVSARRW